MKLTAEQIQSNWENLVGYINDYIKPPRKKKLLEFYNKHQNELMMMPASHKRAYHNAFPGGYVEHVIRVVESAIKISNV